MITRLAFPTDAPADGFWWPAARCEESPWTPLPVWEGPGCRDWEGLGVLIVPKGDGWDPTRYPRVALGEGEHPLLAMIGQWARREELVALPYPGGLSPAEAAIGRWARACTAVLVAAAQHDQPRASRVVERLVPNAEAAIARVRGDARPYSEVAAEEIDAQVRRPMLERLAAAVRTARAERLAARFDGSSIDPDGSVTVWVKLLFSGGAWYWVGSRIDPARITGWSRDDLVGAVVDRLWPEGYAAAVAHHELRTYQLPESWGPDELVGIVAAALPEPRRQTFTEHVALIRATGDVWSTRMAISSGSGNHETSDAVRVAYRE